MDSNTTPSYIVISENKKSMIVFLFSLLIGLSGFLFNSPAEIIDGFMAIITSPSILVSDYFAIGNIGASLLNGGILMMIAVIIAKIHHVNMNGPVMAAVYTIGGFAFFGKNIFNVWPILFGVWLHAKYQKEKFSKFILPAFFGTALSPIVSQISFGLDIPMPMGLVYGMLAGVLAGFVLPPLATHFVRFHQGFNLYNIGFTSGIVGMMFMAFLRAYGFNNPPTLEISSGNNTVFTFALFILFTNMLLVGVFTSKNLKQHLQAIMNQSGRLVSDFVSTDGFGASMVNMALLGYVSTIYVLLVGGQLSGPSIGGIFTIVGFGAFGKHLKNITPLFIGVYLAAVLKIWEPSATGALLAALFGTTLAPIAGAYGFGYGIIAGFFHMAVVMNVGILHGGMNLYNNGFAGGFVAAVLVPIFDALKRNQQT